jgi:glycosyltransferase involved in cell wall biosynthesis
MRYLTVMGNGAHRTGAPTSLLAILRRRPADVSVRCVLVGGGPLLPDFAAVSDEVVVVPGPTTRGARPARVAEELRLLQALAAITPRHDQERLAVNTVEVEAALRCALRWPRPGRVMIRERLGYTEGLRGALRVRLLTALPPGHLCGVGARQASEWAARLDRPVRHLMNIYEWPVELCVDAEISGPLRFLVVGGRSSIKGVDLAQAAFDRIPEVSAQLLIASPDFAPRDEARTRWLGDVPELGAKVGGLADVLLGVSRQETFSRTVVEAALAGVPTLGWDAEGYTEQVAMLGGWLVPDRDLRAMAAKIAELVEEGRVGVRREGRRAQERAVAVLDPQETAAAWWEWLLA